MASLAVGSWLGLQYQTALVTTRLDLGAIFLDPYLMFSYYLTVPTCSYVLVFHILCSHASIPIVYLQFLTVYLPLLLSTCKAPPEFSHWVVGVFHSIFTFTCIQSVSFTSPDVCVPLGITLLPFS